MQSFKFAPTVRIAGTIGLLTRCGEIVPSVQAGFIEVCMSEERV
jgi:hypothetical protein